MIFSTYEVLGMDGNNITDEDIIPIKKTWS